MKKVIVLTLFFTLLSFCSFSQTYQNVTLPSAYPVTLEIASEFSSDEVTEGQAVKLAVKTAVIIDGTTVIPTRALATGRVLKIKESSFNYAATVTIEVLTATTIEGKVIDLHGETTFKGQNKGEAVSVKIGQLLDAAVSNVVSVKGVRQ